MVDVLDLSPGAVIAGIVILIVAAIVLLRVARGVLPTLRKAGRFLDDWQGEPDRPGVPGRPGVMEQLSALREEQIRTRDGLIYTDGRPLKEVVGDIAAKQVQDSARLDTLTQVIGHSVAKQAEERVEGHKAATAAWHAVEAVAEHREATS